MLTDLAITGKPAQFGRGVMQDVSDKLLGQFVACLETGSPDPPSRARAEAPGAPRPGGRDRVAGAAARQPRRPLQPSRPAPRRDTAPVRRRAEADDSLDLGATVLPVLLKSYWKQGAAGWP